MKAIALSLPLLAGLAMFSVPALAHDHGSPVHVAKASVPALYAPITVAEVEAAQKAWGGPGGYVRGADGKLRIVLHHSSLPYAP